MFGKTGGKGTSLPIVEREKYTGVDTTIKSRQATDADWARIDAALKRKKMIYQQNTENR